MNEAKALLRNCPTSPQKMRYTAETIRGKDVEEALNTLQFAKRHNSVDLRKLLRSAIANWEQKNEGYKAEDSQLFIKQIFVDGGRMTKRWLNAPHGRAYKMRKRSNHVTIIIDSKLNNHEEAVESTTTEKAQA